MPQTIITPQEFNKLKSNGEIRICRSCLDNKNQFVMLSYKIGQPSVVSDFCPSCIKSVSTCGSCKSNTK